MKKILLPALLAVTVLLFQNCKKNADDITATTSTPTLQATVNGLTWAPDTLSATIAYHSATKTKVFTFTGTQAQKRVTCSVTITNATNTADFPLSGYTVDATGNPSMVYSMQQKDGSGNYVFVPLVTAAQNYGYLAVSAVDATNHLITGSFNFSAVKTNYDGNGNVVSVTNTAINGGYFTNMSYTYTSD